MGRTMPREPLLMLRGDGLDDVARAAADALDDGLDMPPELLPERLTRSWTVLHGSTGRSSGKSRRMS